MSSDINVSPDIPGAPRYARFFRRLRGMFIDWALMLFVLFGALLLAASVSSDKVSRGLGFLVVATLLLYEPVLVSWTGGTFGHRFTNLRVVDDRHGGNISFLKACVRAVIKGMLGWYSFMGMAATRRNQAVHDLLTRSTVQIRDAAKASDAHSIIERAELALPDRPSRLRRTGIIGIYLLLSFVLYFCVAVGLIAAGAVSAACVGRDICSFGETILTTMLGAGYFALAAALIGLGWRGKLYGARQGS